MDPFQGNCWLADLYGLRTYRLSDLGACGLTVQYTTVDCWIFVWLKLFCWRCAKINQVNPNMIPEKISKNDFVVLPSQRHDQRRLHRHVKMKINPSLKNTGLVWRVTDAVNRKRPTPTPMFSRLFQVAMKQAQVQLPHIRNPRVSIVSFVEIPCNLWSRKVSWHGTPGRGMFLARLAMANQ